MSIMEQLTERQREIMSQIITGASQKETARTMQISPNTLRNHLVNARKATGCVSTIELAVKFYVEAIHSNG